MPRKAALLDLDGTLIRGDTVDVLCEIVGKKPESVELNALLHAGRMGGLDSLMARLDFLKGVSLEQIGEKLAENPYLMKGAKELIAYFRKQEMVTILASGNIWPVLEYYKQILGIDHYIGTGPGVHFEGNVMVGFDRPDRGYKAVGSGAILRQQDIVYPDHVIAIGNSPVDKVIFNLASLSIAINPEAEICGVDYIIMNDLGQAIPIIDAWIET